MLSHSCFLFFVNGTNHLCLPAWRSALVKNKCSLNLQDHFQLVTTSKLRHVNALIHKISTRVNCIWGIIVVMCLQKCDMVCKCDIFKFAQMSG